MRLPLFVFPQRFPKTSDETRREVFIYPRLVSDRQRRHGAEIGPTLNRETRARAWSKMMNFEFKCPQCGQMVEADEAYRGQVAECPHCGKGIVVPRRNPRTGTAHNQGIGKGGTVKDLCIINQDQKHDSAGFCSKCGNKLSGGENFCGKCGTARNTAGIPSSAPEANVTGTKDNVLSSSLKKKNDKWNLHCHFYWGDNILLHS